MKPPAPILKPRAVAADTGAATLGSSSAIWTAVPLVPDFADQMRAAFDAELRPVDFAASQTLPMINGWYAERTRGRIPRPFDRFDGGTKMVVGNALCFRGSWQLPFNPERTQEATFRTPGDTVRVPTMHQRLSHAGHREERGARAPRLVFEGQRFEMIFVLPAAGADPADLLAPGTATAWLRDAWPQRDRPSQHALQPTVRLRCWFVMCPRERWSGPVSSGSPCECAATRVPIIRRCIGPARWDGCCHGIQFTSHPGHPGPWPAPHRSPEVRAPDRMAIERVPCPGRATRRFVTS